MSDNEISEVEFEKIFSEITKCSEGTVWDEKYRKKDETLDKANFEVDEMITDVMFSRTKKNRKVMFK